MAAFLEPVQIDDLLRSFALGTAGAELSLPGPLADCVAGLEREERTLAALALMAQHQRFAMPELPADLKSAQPDMAAALHDDQRVILPAHVRRKLARLLGLPDADVRRYLVDAALDRIEASGMRVHPFDLPRLRSFLLERPGRLGASEKAYLRLSAGDQPSDQPVAFFADEMSEETWRDYTPAPRMAFLARLRRQDPAQARALIESCFSDEPANIRADMIKVLAVRLSEDDEPFLVAAASDRAQSVKTEASVLLTRLPGTQAYRDRLTELGNVLKIEKSGLIKRRPVLNVRLPKPKGKDRVTALSALDGLRLSDMARSTGFKVDDTPQLIGADDDDLCTALIAAALSEDDYAMARRIAGEAAAGNWHECLNDIGETLASHPEHVVRGIVVALFQRDPCIGRANDMAWLALYDILREPLPEPVWRGILKTKWLKALFKQNKENPSEHAQATAGYVTILARLVPDDIANDFIAAVEEIGPLAVAPALAFLEFQFALHSSGTDTGPQINAV